MALSDDQKAMLRLLAQREQGYEDIGALMGLTVDEVRARVKAALEEIDTPSAAPSPVQQPAAAEPPPPPRAEPPPIPAEPRPQAEPLSVPAGPPPAPHKQEDAARPPAQAPPPASRSHGVALPKGKGARISLGVGALALVVIVVLLLTGAFGGGSESKNAANPTPKQQGEAGLPSASQQQPTAAILTAPGGGAAKGRALFGRAGQKVVLLALAQGLSPSPQGKSYAISLARSSQERVPIAAAKVGSSGRIEGQFEVSPTVVGLLATGFDEMEMALVSNSELRTALAKANKAGQTPTYGGIAVLRGKVTGPFVNAGLKGGR